MIIVAYPSNSRGAVLPFKRCCDLLDATVRTGNDSILPDSNMDIHHVLHRIELSSCDVPRLLQIK